MTRPLVIRYVTHSLRSCWNHGNAHFLRGVLRELRLAGHDVHSYEAPDAWSARHLAADHGAAMLSAWAHDYPELAGRVHVGIPDAAALLDGADVVIVHEWNDPALVAALGAERARSAGGAVLLFHDTHHRAVTAPHEMARYDLDGYDGVLAFGETLSELYRARGWGREVVTWHEAADTRHFRPLAVPHPRSGVAWIGNWGDGERATELRDFLLRPVRDAGLELRVWGVRYPDDALAMLAAHGASWMGWAPNTRVPALFATHLATVHVPRRAYVQALPGIPTIRVFEALACGIPLVSAPWDDTESLFRRGTDHLVAHDSVSMTRTLRTLHDDRALRDALVHAGLETIRARHTCAHRARELLQLVGTLRAPAAAPA